MSIGRFQTAAVIGTGMMGPGIAVTLAQAGITTTILSRTQEGADAGLAKATEQAAMLAKHGLIETADLPISASDQLDETVKAVDVVIESGPEKLAWKKELFAHLDAICKGDAVLATNTSSISITDIASASQHQERIVTTHFWNPPHLMPLVEIVMGAKTSPTIAEEVKALLTYCGKTAVIVKKDRPGQLGNRLQMALLREAIYIVQRGIASAEDVDLVTKNGFGLRLPVYGVFEHQDMVGLDLGGAVLDYTAPDLYSEPDMPRYMKDLMLHGKLGAKTGEGFLQWTDESAREVRARRDQFVLEMALRKKKEEQL